MYYVNYRKPEGKPILLQPKGFCKLNSAIKELRRLIKLGWVVQIAKE